MSATKILGHLEPASIWENFALLCDTPHPSGHVEAISNLMESFGKKLNLQTVKDKTGNVIIKKPASVNERQHKKPIILQAHLDMVPQVENHVTEFDFKQKSIEPIVDGDWVTAKDTTLGADNGIGVAMIMAILSSTDIKHGPIEALFTVEEETNQAGVINLDPKLLTGDTLINLDSESEDQLCIGSAGGVKTHISMPYMLETVDNHDGFRLTISGLLGGHSGCDIVEERANAIELLARLLWQLQRTCDIRVARIYGGSPIYNVIPRESYALITVPKIKTQRLLDAIPIKQKEISEEYTPVEKNITIELTPVNKIAHTIERQVQKRMVNALFGSPNGIIRTSCEMPEIPETSTNLSYVSTQKDHVTIFSMQRSLVDSSKVAIANRIHAVFELAGGRVKQVGSFPCWRADSKSPILEKTIRVYKESLKKNPQVIAVHAGLECGYLKEKNPKLHIISLGPNIIHPHSPS